VGWIVLDNANFDFSNLEAAGISFVGDITPVGHLLQMTAAIVHCFKIASKQAEIVIIDTPGFISTSAACALWWTVQKILQPQLILAVQRKDELTEILSGLKTVDKKIEKISCPVQIPAKSLQQRQQYRQQQFNKYFHDSKIYNINLKDMAIQKGLDSGREKNGRLIALRDEKGNDIAIGQIKEWNEEKSNALIKTSQIDIQQIRCLVIGDVSIEITDER
jgi:polynucleotide 5'-kinase involved in rRNA processing